MLRSMLFVPGDSEKKIIKALVSEADALIFDLEDSVAPIAKEAARHLVAETLAAQRERATSPQLWVRINSLRSMQALPDLAAIVAGSPAGIMLPKADSADDVRTLDHYLSALEASANLPSGQIKILPIVTETAAAVFAFATYAPGMPRLVGLTWGAEDLAAAVGATANRNEHGELLPLYQLARNLCLVASAAAETIAIDGIFLDYNDEDGLRRECQIAKRDGFFGKLAIHPAQIAVIHQEFWPSEAEIATAEEIVTAFATANSGVISHHGKMLDLPHLRQAERVLQQVQPVKKAHM